MKYMKTQLNNN